MVYVLSLVQAADGEGLKVISAAFAVYASAGCAVVIGHGYEFGDPNQPRRPTQTPNSIQQLTLTTRSFHVMA